MKVNRSYSVLDVFLVLFNMFFVSSFRFRFLPLQLSAWLFYACCHFLLERLVFIDTFHLIHRTENVAIGFNLDLVTV